MSKPTEAIRMARAIVQHLLGDDVPPDEHLCCARIIDANRDPDTGREAHLERAIASWRESVRFHSGLRAEAETEIARLRELIKEEARDRLKSSIKEEAGDD